MSVPLRRVHLSPYRIMWLFVMFDLPVTTKKARKEATEFRKRLLKIGFEMSQYSVYHKYCASSEKADSIGAQVKRILPSGGKVDVLTITDKQFGNIKRYYAKLEKKNKNRPRQLHLF